MANNALQRTAASHSRFNPGDLSPPSLSCKRKAAWSATVMFIDPDNPLAAEILQEAGEAYFAGCKRMVASLEALSAFDRAVGSSAQDDEQVRRRTQLLDEAAERVHFVVIQRDAMQLSWSETFLDN